MSHAPLIHGAAVTADFTRYQYSNLGIGAISLFRMTTGDVDYQTLENLQPTFMNAFGMVWIFVSSIVFMNLFIAMLSNTYQTITDNATKVAAMERARIVLGCELRMNNKLRRSFHEWIEDTLTGK